MGERDTAWPEPGYNGICNYAQKITSCFGLDGKSSGWGKGTAMVVRVVQDGCRKTSEVFWYVRQWFGQICFP